MPARDLRGALVGLGEGERGRAKEIASKNVQDSKREGERERKFNAVVLQNIYNPSSKLKSSFSPKLNMCMD